MPKFICDEQFNCGDSSSQETVSGPLQTIDVCSWAPWVTSSPLFPRTFSPSRPFFINFYFISEYICFLILVSFRCTS